MDEREDRTGFDAAIIRREDDRLNRWAFAKEIYGIAITGPRKWSVRIGIYGEWGTGKSSVLNLVEKMARSDKHVIVKFNPWEFATHTGLWSAFILAVHQALNAALPDNSRAKKGIRKYRIGKSTEVLKDLVSGAAGVLNDNLGKAVEAAASGGIQLLKKCLTFSKTDLKNLSTALGKRRVLVLVDDLDRADPHLVPEILFALKEIMDVEGFAFICVFDPEVVGKVLGKYHEGFGDGLNFLDKIIDYPRWLPEPTEADILAMATSDVRDCCPFVPVHSMEAAIRLLPRNPRTTRQFIRLLTLLKPQISRHYDHELHWPTILAANVLKIRFSRLAPKILGDQEFWHNIYVSNVVALTGPKPEPLQLIAKYLDKVLAESKSITVVQRKEIEETVAFIASQMQGFTSRNDSFLNYQMHIAENPHAVTEKEFDQFLETWKSQPTSSAADNWLKQHAETMGPSYEDVYQALFEAAAKRYDSELNRTLSEPTPPSGPAPTQRVKVVMKLLEALTFDLGRLSDADKRLRDADFRLILGVIASHLGLTTTDEYRGMRAKEKDYLCRLVKAWAPDITPLVRVLGIFDDSAVHHLEGKQLAP